MAVWLVGAGVGMAMLDRFENTPGSAGAAPDRWPPQSGIARAARGPTLVVFLHPQCTCSRATLTEVAEIATATQGTLATRVLLLDTTPGRDDVQAPSDLWARAAAIPGVSVARDVSGVEARRFGAETSGQTLLYDEAGVLRFAGGVTPARGVAGDNRGREAILGLVTGGAAMADATPAFGCALQDPPVPDPVRAAAVR